MFNVKPAVGQADVVLWSFHHAFGQVHVLRRVPGQERGTLCYVGRCHYDMAEPALVVQINPDDADADSDRPLPEVFGLKRKGRSNLTDAARVKRRKVCNGADILGEEHLFYEKSVTESAAFAGLRKHVQTPQTFQLHWRWYRGFVGFLLEKGLAQAPVAASKALTREHLKREQEGAEKEWDEEGWQDEWAEEECAEEEWEGEVWAWEKGAIFAASARQRKNDKAQASVQRRCHPAWGEGV